jgi:uncharacterized protein YbcI
MSATDQPPGSLEHDLPGTANDSATRRYSARAAISNAIVRIHAHSYGRGPTKARTFLGTDHALCLLEDIFTPAERTLIDGGEGRQVEEIRRTFQRVARDEFIGAVEEVTGRTVKAFFSNVQCDPDMAVELFVFESLPELDGAVDGSDGRSDEAL